MTRFRPPRLFLFLLAALLLIAAAPCAADQKPIWFGDLTRVKPLWAGDDDQGMGPALANYAAAPILGRPFDKAALDEAIRGDDQPRIVFVSVSDGQSAAQVHLGRGKGVLAAIDDAVDGIELKRLGKPPLRWVKFDLVMQAGTGRKGPLNQKIRTDPTIWGLAFEEQTGAALLPEELIARSLITPRGSLMLQSISDYLKQREPAVNLPSPLGLRENDEQALSLFRCASYYTDGRQTIRLFRGHRHEQFQRPKGAAMRPGEGLLAPERLLASAVDAAAYLQRRVGEDGRFVYEFEPGPNRQVNDYNILRHAGTCYAMLQVYEVTRDRSLLEATERALDYLAKQARPMHLPDRKVAAVVEDDEIKLGGNALAVLALAKYQQVNGEKKYESLTKQLGDWIRAIQLPNGQFAFHKQDAKTGDPDRKFVSTYYPGEAALAMVRLHSIDPQDQWLDVAAKSAQFILQSRYEGLGLRDIPIDHWMLITLNELYPHRRGPMIRIEGAAAADTRQANLFLTKSRLLAAAMILRQNRNTVHPDWQGGHYKPPRSTSTACVSEGLAAAYSLHRDHGDTTTRRDLPAILESLDYGIRFQLQCQMRPERAMYFDDPQRSLGAFHGELHKFDIRIDYCQHNISSLINYRQILLEAEKEQAQE